jgi:hypothetical protein
MLPGVFRSFGAFELRRVALGWVALDPALHPLPLDIVIAGDGALLRPSNTTAVMTRRAFDMADLADVPRSQLCRETSANYVVKPDTAPATLVTCFDHNRSKEARSSFDRHFAVTQALGG